jgi:hypothetical protein
VRLDGLSKFKKITSSGIDLSVCIIVP